VSYYTDLDNDLGAIEEAENDAREYEYEERQRKAAFNRAVKNEVAKQLSKAGVTVEKKPTRGAKVEVSCASCGKPFMARVADRKRGWGKYCSKSCKAMKQGRR